MLIVCYHLILFTDVNSMSSSKYWVGWSMVAFSIANLIFPNMYFVVNNMWLLVRDWYQDKLHKRSRRYKDSRFFEARRKELVERYNLKLKTEFMEEPETIVDVDSTEQGL